MLHHSIHFPKLALIDLDGVLIDASVRFRRAEDLRRAHPTAGSKESWNYYWQEALNPDFFHLDSPIAGSKEHLADLTREGYTIVYLSSRLEDLRLPTVRWLVAHGIPAPALLLLKVTGFRYQKTPAWYGWMAETLAFATDCRDLLIVSDKTANLSAMQASLVESGYEPVRYYTSLAAIFDAATGADEPPAGEEGDPFLPDFPPA